MCIRDSVQRRCCWFIRGCVYCAAVCSQLFRILRIDGPEPQQHSLDISRCLNQRPLALLSLPIQSLSSTYPVTADGMVELPDTACTTEALTCSPSSTHTVLFECIFQILIAVLTCFQSASFALWLCVVSSASELATRRVSCYMYSAGAIPP